MTRRTAISARPAFIAVATASCLLTLSGCGSDSATPVAPSASPTPTSPTPTSTATGGALAVAQTTLGTVVTTKDGRTVYVYDKDTPGTARSACTGACLGLWPPVEAAASAMPVPGLSGALGTIAAPDGGRQLTLDGLPLYTYAGDTAPGDVTGQGVGGIWWVVGPTGMKLTASASASGSTPAPTPMSSDLGGRSGY